jgi:hypothetical protein
LGLIFKLYQNICAIGGITGLEESNKNEILYKVKG